MNMRSTAPRTSSPKNGKNGKNGKQAHAPAAPIATAPMTATPERILQRLDWHIVRRLDGLLQGDYRSLFYGNGIDFADLREYQAEDDIRFIDWNVTARMDIPHVRQYVEDREVTAWFLLDLSPSVDFGTAPYSDAADVEKRMVLVNVVAVLSRLLTRLGNRVGAVFYGSQVQHTVPARSGRVQVLRLINDLLKQPRLKQTEMTNLAPLFEAGVRGFRRRSLVFIISDFISAPGWERALSLLTQRHEVIAIRLYDPREMELPDVGPIYMEDAETGEQIFVDTRDKKFRQRFQKIAQRRVADLNQTFKRAGVELLSLSTEEDLTRAIVRFAGLRKQRRKK